MSCLSCYCKLLSFFFGICPCNDTRKWKSEQIKPEAASMTLHALIPPPLRANRSIAADEIDSTAIEPLSNEPVQAPRTHKFLLCPKMIKKRERKT